MKTLIFTFTFIALFFSSLVSANKLNDFFLDVGVGVEYGGLGTQFHLPFKLDDLDVFMSAGLFSASTLAGSEVGLGAGINYFLDKNNSVSLYYGALNSRSYYTDDLETKSELDYGISLGYKYFFNEHSRSGFSVGISYNVYADDSYPFFSLGYRF